MYRRVCGMKIILMLFVASGLCDLIAAQNAIEREKDAKVWLRKGRDAISDQLSRSKNENIAENIILFIGDGMGVSTVTAARILDGQLKGEPGEENQFYFEKFDDVAFSKTYNIDRQTPDSAGSATAMLCGVKTNIGVLGLDGHSVLGDCAASASAEELSSLLDWAQAAGKRTGIVTTSRITHATPAAAYANSPSRNWEGDAEISERDAPCKDIARQLIEDNKDINVILGGGRRYFLPSDAKDPETGSIDYNQRVDGQNLIEEWLDDKKNRDKKASYVWNRDQLMTLTDNIEYLLGLFSPSHMDYDLERQEYGVKSEPSLAEMVERAIEILEEGDNGFFLLVEGARIDHAHHANQAKKALYDVIAMDNAVKAARRHTSWQDTLMLVTADHSHPFNMASYSTRGRDILDLADSPALAADGLPFTTLLYGNGLGYRAPREDLSSKNTKADDYRFHSGVAMYSSTHAGEDVAIYAKGPMSHLVNGIQEQSYVAHVAAYAACIGPYGSGNLKKKCKSRTPMD